MMFHGFIEFLGYCGIIFKGIFTIKMKFLNVPQTGKFVCHSSDRILQKQKHVTRKEIIAKISNTI